MLIPQLLKKLREHLIITVKHSIKLKWSFQLGSIIQIKSVQFNSALFMEPQMTTTFKVLYSPFSISTQSDKLDSDWLVFHYNQEPPNVHGRHSNTAERSMMQLACETKVDIETTIYLLLVL